MVKWWPLLVREWLLLVKGKAKNLQVNGNRWTLAFETYGISGGSSSFDSCREPGGPSWPAIEGLESGTKPGVGPPRGPGVGPKRGLFMKGSIKGCAIRVGRVIVGFPRIEIQGIDGMVNHKGRRVSARKRRKRNGQAKEGIEGPSRVVTRECKGRLT